ncbi:ABC transporter ATPase [Tenacibaculum sp. C7A-26P2]|uniref:ABC transporter ATPase n=1 Tax=Tenacibaculum sp. C7A-26P2 TaxID=3447504 RepID=UPI003F840D32
MFIESSALSDEARVWVYPASRKFYAQEVDEIINKLHSFVSSWKKSSMDFQASFELKYNRFIIFFAENNIQLTNNDIDEQVSFILTLQNEYKLDLLDKMNVCFKQGEFVQYKEIKAFKKLLKEKAVSPKTIVFDNLVQSKYDFENYWEVPITDSWYNRFL